MLQDKLPGCRFLDLFAGSGGIGIEAISRGAKEAVFVDQSRAACRCIQDNLAFTRFTPKASVIQMDVLRALHRLEGRFDIIFMDPPYRQMLERSVLEEIMQLSLADEGTSLIVEAAKETDFSYLSTLGLQTDRRKEYKTNVHMFLSIDPDLPLCQ